MYCVYDIYIYIVYDQKKAFLPIHPRNHPVSKSLPRGVKTAWSRVLKDKMNFGTKICIISCSKSPHRFFNLFFMKSNINYHHPHSHPPPSSSSSSSMQFSWPSLTYNNYRCFSPTPCWPQNPQTTVDLLKAQTSLTQCIKDLQGETPT